MYLIFGGAYQGKKEYAKEQYGLDDADFFICHEDKEIDFHFKAVCNLEKFVLHCLRKGEEAKDVLEKHRKDWKSCIMICTDISSGIVPYDKEQRAWREMTGRTMVYLGKEAEEVTRIFCGLPQKLK